ncbi:MAG: bifunctional riboflavin kinase/FAD synthetase [Caulobacterales bacterium]
MSVRVLDGLAPAPSDLRGASIALGVMDGVHHGHQAVLAAARNDAHARGAPFCAAVFEPHPRHYFQEGGHFRIQSAAQRARAIAALGADAVFEIKFDKALADMPAEVFARDVLAGKLGAKHVSVGFDFQYGHRRGGNAETLRQQGETLGFTVSAAPAITDQGERISSTSIRAHISEGGVENAAALMGRPFAIEGIVSHGQQLGRTIGFPTINVWLKDYVRPRLGVYAVRVSIEGGPPRAGVANVGLNPTTSTLPEPRLETFVFDFNADVYDRMSETSFVGFIRPERKFDSLAAMTAQIDNDVIAAKALLAASS